MYLYKLFYSLFQTDYNKFIFPALFHTSLGQELRVDLSFLEGMM